MHYGIVAIGSRGDVQPFIALSLGLMRRGHRVTLMAHENFRSLLGAFGINFHPLAGNTEEMLGSPEGRRLIQSGKAMTLLRYIQRCMEKVQDHVNRDLMDGCSQVDVLVTSALGVPWVSCIAEKTSKPWTIIQLSFPMDTTRAFPFAGLDYLRFPAYNRFSYRLIRSVFWRQTKRPVNHFRQSLGLSILTKSIFDQSVADHILTLYAVSSTLLPRPSDWPAHIQVTGFLALPPPPEQTQILPIELRKWLPAGNPPIYIGFGSMPVPNPVRLTHVIKELLTRTNHRFIFATGWSTLPDLPTGPRFFIVASINHPALFPHCAAAVIHGGVGTLAATLTAGIPPVIVSIYGDQPWWGKLIQKRQLGSHLPFRRLTADKLITAIDQALTPPVLHHVACLPTQLHREDGLGQTIEHLELYFQHEPSAP